LNAESALIDLEIRLAYQEDAIRALDDLVYAQQRRIEALEQQCRRLAARLEALVMQPLGSPPEIPPHY
jgi:SlyX protein